MSKARLLKKYEHYAGMARPRLASRFGPGFAEEVLADTRKRYDSLIPDLPDIGGRKNQFTPVIEINGWIISFYRAMRDRGKTVEQVVAICAEVSDAWFRRLPGWVLFLARRLAFSRLVKWRMRSQARSSQRRKFPDDFVYQFEESPQGWSLVFEQCAVHKMYQAHDVLELAPFCNFFDVTYSRYLNMGLDASQTIGLGHQFCRLCFRKDEDTLIPDRLEELMPSV